MPGLREAHIAELLRALPKTIRRQLMPFPPKIAEIMKDLRPAGKSLKHDLAEFIRTRYGVAVSLSSWSEAPLPSTSDRGCGSRMEASACWGRAET